MARVAWAQDLVRSKTEPTLQDCAEFQPNGNHRSCRLQPTDPPATTNFTRYLQDLTGPCGRAQVLEVYRRLADLAREQAELLNDADANPAHSDA